MTIRLRGHHLLCLLTFVGKGYTPAFTANYRRIVARLNTGEDVELVDGPDDICGPMLAEADHHCCNAGVAERDTQALADIAVLLGRPVGPGRRLALSSARVAQMRGAFAAGTLRTACAGCQWSGLCSDVAARAFAGTRLDG